MKRLLVGAALAGLALGMGSEAQAALFTPAPGPIYFQFTNKEQVDLRTGPGGAPVNGINCGVGCTEGNWGIAQLSVLRTGSVTTDGLGRREIQNLGGPVQFADGVFPTVGGQLTAMFYGIQQTSITQSGSVFTLKSTGGFIDLYYSEGLNINIGALLPGGRTAQDQYTGITDGTFLVRLAFASGIDPTDPTTFIQGTIDTSAGGVGQADSYANVVDVNGDGVIDGNDGAWAKLLDTNFFDTAFGDRDIRFSNRTAPQPDWAGDDGIVGVLSNDPGRAFAIPEPVTLGLMGSGLLFLGLGARRRRSA